MFFLNIIYKIYVMQWKSVGNMCDNNIIYFFFLIFKVNIEVWMYFVEFNQI